jgi:hypothetical protein
MLVISLLIELFALGSVLSILPDNKLKLDLVFVEIDQYQWMAELEILILDRIFVVDQERMKLMNEFFSWNYIHSRDSLKDCLISYFSTISALLNIHNDMSRRKKQKKFHFERKNQVVKQSFFHVELFGF